MKNKNIWLLPTDKPSELYINMQGVLSKSNSLLLRLKSRNIYITNDEEIKEGDWFLNTRSNAIGQHNGSRILLFKEDKKIILTTDQDLIKDGVQEIDDEFLKWFVKNPSCEEIYVNKIESFDFTIDKYVYGYKIVVPSKDDLKIGDNTNFGIITDINEKSVCFGKNKLGVDVWYKKSYVVKFPNLVLEEPKQECLTTKSMQMDAKIAYDLLPKQKTLEEVIERLYPFTKDDAENRLITIKRLFWIEGAKWQAKRMYSEEEIIDLLLARDIELNSLQGIDAAKRWFEQIKKK